MEKIKEWLDAKEKNLDDGIRLFGEHSKNRAMYERMWRMNRNPKKLLPFLEYQLEKLYKMQVPAAVGTAKAKPEVPLNKEEPKTDELTPTSKPIVVTDDEFQVLTDKLKARYLKVKEEYPKLADLHEQLKACEDADDRKTILAELVRIETFCADFWNDLDAARKNPPEETEEPKEPAQEPTTEELLQMADSLKKSIRNKKTTIARIKKEMPALKGTKKVNKQKDLDRHQVELAGFEADLTAVEGRL